MPKKLARDPSDGGGLNRTTSIEQKKERNDMMLKRKASIEKLQEYTLKLPGAVDVATLEQSIAEAEASNVDAELIANSKKKLAEAKKLQEKKAREARIAALAVRREECTKLLESWVNIAPLDVDMKALGAAIEESDVLAESEGNPDSHISEGLVRQCREKYSEAEAAFEGKRREAAADLESHAATVLTADPEPLRASCERAAQWNVEKGKLEQAHALLAEAVKRDAALTKLQRLTAEMSSLELDVGAVRKALEVASAAAVPAEALVETQAKLRAAEEEQAPREKATKRLECVCGASKRRALRTASSARPSAPSPPHPHTQVKPPSLSFSVLPSSLIHRRCLAKPVESLDSEAVRAAKVDAVEVFVKPEVREHLRTPPSCLQLTSAAFGSPRLPSAAFDCL